MALYRLESEPPQLTAPALVAAFDGWIDAAGASTAAAAHVAGSGDTIATFDGDALFDYRSRRPVLDVVDGTLASLEWPELSVRRARHEGRDVLVLVGPEPDFHWRELGTDLLDLVLRLGVVEWVSLGAIPAAVPHTRGVPVLATASKQGLLHDDEQQGPAGLLRVPGAALSTVEMAVSAAGIPAVGFYAQVPHYVGGPYAAAAIALIERIERHLGVTVPLGSLVDETSDQRHRLDAAVEADEDTKRYLERLETLAGEERVPSGDELATEIERYLREAERGGDDPSPFDGR
jgi:predicted ATP-grasp superfamily ATP-dependent carboligase